MKKNGLFQTILGLRSPVIQKLFQTKTATSIVTVARVKGQLSFAAWATAWLLCIARGRPDLSRRERRRNLAIFFFLFFSHTFTFQLLDKPRSQVSPLLPPGSCLQVLSRIGFSNATARRFFIQYC